LTRVRRFARSARAPWPARLPAGALLVAAGVLASLLPATSRAQFDLGENEPSVKRVEIVGNTAYEDKTLKSLLRTRQKSFFHPWRDAPLRSDFLRYDRVVIQDFYRRHGYLDARVDTVEVVQGRGKDVVVRFALDEGPRAQVTGIDFTGTTAAEEEALRETIPLAAGDPFDFPQVEMSHAAIESLYAERGHVIVAIRDSIEVTSHGVRVRFDVRPGPSATLRSIVVEGTSATKPTFVAREVVLKPGDILARSRLIRSQQRIYDSGLYTDVQFSTGEVDSAAQATDLIVSVRERRLGWVDAGIGVAYKPGLSSQEAGDVLRLSAQVGQRNLFREAIQALATARFGIRASTKPQFPYVRDLFAGNRRADLSLTRGWLAGLRLQGTLGAFAEEVPPAPERPYPYRAIGASAGLRRDLDFWTRVTLVYQPLRVFSDSVAALTPDSLFVRSYSSNRVVVALDHDTRLDLFDPRRGTVAGGTAEFAGGAFSGTAQFLKLAGTASGYRPWGRKVTLAIRGRAGLIFSRGQGPSAGLEDKISRLELVPVNDRFFLGGANSVRGYHDNEIGQIRIFGANDSTVSDQARGGSFLLLGNVELRARLIGFLGGALFLDAGNVWERTEDVTWRRVFSLSGGAGYKDMKYAVGGGVRIATPVGPVRLDYGWKLRLARPDEPDPVTGRGAFAFSLGQAF
jgi:outer membrane protein insertion porin family